jgi:2-phospho-L-lactate guanylyltransferase (CobY/MobA/RfbA family)
LVVDEGSLQGMNKAIGQGIDFVRNRGSHRVVVLPADLPLACGGEIDRMLLTMEGETFPDQPAVVGLSGAADGEGTNFLSVETAQPFETRFGRDSFQQHQACALADGFRTVLLASNTLSIDIDCEKDLQELISYYSRHPEYQCTSSWKFLSQHRLVGAPEQSG